MEELTRKQKRVLLLLLVAVLLGAGLLLTRSVERGPVEVITTQSLASFKEEASSSKDFEDLLTVHICGAVKNPGVYLLPNGARVHEAIATAGGALEEADLHLLNLASLVKDGERLNIPGARASGLLERTAGNSAEDRQSLVSPRPETQQESGPRLIDPNTATSRELQTLPGIGPALAERIIDYREQVGRFERLQDLEKVKGIGPKTLEKMKDYLDLRP